MNGKKQCKRCKKYRSKLFGGICARCKFKNKTRKRVKDRKHQGFPFPY